MKCLSVLCISLIATSLMLAGISDAKIDKKSIMGMWLFNEGKGETAKDSLKNGTDGKLIDGPNWVKGKFSGALELDGSDDYVKIESPNIPRGDDPRSIAGWIMDMGTGGTWGGIIHYGNNDCTGLMFGMGKQNGLTFWGGCKDFQTGMVIPKDKWSFVAVTYDQKNITMWLNGKPSPNSMTNFDTTDSHLFIGAETINNGVGFRSRFTGLIDEIAIFDVALTKNDLNTIMKNGLEVATGFRSVSTTGKLTTIWGQIKKWNGSSTLPQY